MWHAPKSFPRVSLKYVRSHDMILDPYPHAISHLNWYEFLFPHLVVPPPPAATEGRPEKNILALGGKGRLLSKYIKSESYVYV